jgi:hypothetical protein
VARHLIAHKRVSYAGRSYRPGVAFMAKPAHARVLVASGMARFAQPLADPLMALRANYEAITGRKPHPFWREARLTAEIDAAKAAQAADEGGEDAGQ